MRWLQWDDPKFVHEFAALHELCRRNELVLTLGEKIEISGPGISNIFTYTSQWHFIRDLYNSVLKELESKNKLKSKNEANHKGNNGRWLNHLNRCATDEEEAAMREEERRLGFSGTLAARGTLNGTMWDPRYD